ncbi:MAG: amidohydrolase family protein [Bacteroidia bacterium]|nr:amidohydrolase family protein [Bacteroidia bacterium]
MKKILLIPFLFISFAGKTQFMLQNVNVVTMNDSVVLKGQDVIIVNDKIVDVFPTGQKGADNVSKVIDGKGMYLMPGFADMHAHLPKDGKEFSNKEYMRLMLQSGITTVRSMRGNASELKLRDSLKQGLLKGPDLFVSAVLPSADSMMKGNWKTDFFENAVKNKYDFVKHLGGINIGDMMEISHMVKKNNLVICGHAFEGKVDKSQLFGFRSIEHYQPFLKKYTENPAQFTLQAQNWKQADLFFCPTFSFYYIFGFQFTADELKNRNGMKLISKKIKSGWEKEISEFESAQIKSSITDTTLRKDAATIKKTREQLKLKKAESFKTALRALRIMDSVGVNVLISADDGNFNVPGYSLFEEMKIYASGGFSNYKIYKMATVNAAAFFKKENYTGTVTKNSFANLCLYEKNPLEKLDNLKTLKAVVIGGKFFWKKEI